MSPTVIRFRCHRCTKLNSVAASRAETIVVCPSCFGPLRVPGLLVAEWGSPDGRVPRRSHTRWKCRWSPPSCSWPRPTGSSETCALMGSRARRRG